MKIMHVADLHLDSPFRGMGFHQQAIQKHLIQSPYQAFERCVSIAINQNVDVFLIVGDVYDADRQTIYAQNFFMKQLVRLDKANIQVVLNHGNHDFIQADKKRPQYPKSVHVFNHEEVEHFDLVLADQTTVRCYGFSYLQRWVKERMIQRFPKNPRATDYTIGLLHGSAEGIASTEGNYAPFSVQELLSKQYDYWALGHIHQAMVLNENPLIQYSGTIQGRHRNEVGDKGAFIVEIQKNSPISSEFISLAPIVWQNANIDCLEEWQASDVVTHIELVIENYLSEAEVSLQSQILTITLNNAQRLNQELQQQIEQGGLSFALETRQTEAPFVHVAKLRLNSNVALDAFQYDEALNKSFHEASDELENGSTYETVMSDILQHSIIQKWLPELVEDSGLKDEIIKSSQQLMIQTIGFETKEVTHED